MIPSRNSPKRVMGRSQKTLMTCCPDGPESLRVVHYLSRGLLMVIDSEKVLEPWKGDYKSWNTAFHLYVAH